jgi:pyruvate formate lyase activating enzyme
LDFVLDTLVWLINETDVWFEITTLLIPGENDSDTEINQECDWILKNLGDEVPLHFTAFHPDFKMLNKSRTPESTLLKARKIALSAGIKYCYVGNIFHSEGHTTFCHNCNTSLIKRDWHDVLTNHIKDGKCPKCSTIIPGIFR